MERKTPSMCVRVYLLLRPPSLCFPLSRVPFVLELLEDCRCPRRLRPAAACGGVDPSIILLGSAGSRRAAESADSSGQDQKSKNIP